MSTTKEVTIFISEDHLIARMGLKMLIEQTNHFKVIGEAEDGESAIENIRLLKPEVIIMDLGLPKIDGIAATEIIKRELPQSKVLIFTTAEDDDSIFAALKAGADGYCLKTISGELLASAIHSVLNGAAWLDPGIANKVLRAQSSGQQKPGANLTDSKLKLLAMLEQGKTLDEIAVELSLNSSFVKGLLNELLNQLKSDPASEVARATPDGTVKSSSPYHNIQPGDVVAEHYKVDERIGHGGMGAVFRASHTIIGRKVAIKTLHEHLASDPDILARFKTEAEASAAVVHPNLVTIYDFGLLNGKMPYIVMEFLDGFDLSDMIKELGCVDVASNRHIFAQVCEALSAAHEKGIIHRDLKPSNIMLTGDDPYVVKLVDFGIAKVLDGAREALTLTGEAIGSPPYMSPEQCYGRPVDHRSDLYSLGCVMYQSYTGTRPFDNGTPLEVMMKHINETPSREPLEKQELPKSLVDLIMALLEKEPELRPVSAAEVRQVLLKT